MNQHKKLTITIALLLTLSLTLPTIIPFNGNITTVEAASQKTKIKNTVKNFFKYSKAMNISKMKTCVTADNRADIGSFNDSTALKSYMKKRNQKLACSIKSVKVSGSTAKVKVTCKYLNSKNGYTQMVNDTMFWLVSESIMGRDYTKLTEKQLLKKMNPAIKKSFKDNPKAYDKKYKKKTFHITLKKVKGKWQISKLDKNLMDAISSNYYSSADRAFEAILKDAVS